jgi:hypothetical protein
VLNVCRRNVRIVINEAGFVSDRSHHVICEPAVGSEGYGDGNVGNATGSMCGVHYALRTDQPEKRPERGLFILAGQEEDMSTCRPKSDRGTIKRHCGGRYGRKRCSQELHRRIGRHDSARGELGQRERQRRGATLAALILASPASLAQAGPRGPRRADSRGRR